MGEEEAKAQRKGARRRKRKRDDLLAELGADAEAAVTVKFEESKITLSDIDGADGDNGDGGDEDGKARRKAERKAARRIARDTANQTEQRDTDRTVADAGGDGHGNGGGGVDEEKVRKAERKAARRAAKSGEGNEDESEQKTKKQKLEIGECKTTVAAYANFLTSAAGAKWRESEGITMKSGGNSDLEIPDPFQTFGECPFDERIMGYNMYITRAVFMPYTYTWRIVRTVH
jgi:hypothetical protein